MNQPPINRVFRNGVEVSLDELSPTTIDGDVVVDVYGDGGLDPRVKAMFGGQPASHDRGPWNIDRLDVPPQPMRSGRVYSVTLPRPRNAALDTFFARHEFHMEKPSRRANRRRRAKAKAKR